MNILRKLTTKAILGEKPSVKKEQGQVWLYQVAGVASGIKSGTGNYGDWTALTGSFVARRLDGEVFRSSVLFLPEPGHGILINKVTQNNGQEIQFALNIGIKYSEESKTKYEYVTDFPIEPENDPVMGMLSKVPALPESKQLTDQSKEKPESDTKKNTAKKK